MIPQVGKIYKHYDDGKIRTSRQYEVVVTEVIPFRKIKRKWKKFWKEEKKNCDWLYSPETDYFIKGTTTDDSIEEELLYVRDKMEGWFSLGYWGGKLDVDGSLTEDLTNF